MTRIDSATGAVPVTGEPAKEPNEPMWTATPDLPSGSFSGGDAVTAALAAMAELGRALRSLGREQRREAATRAHAAMKEQAKELRAKADDLRSGAMWSTVALGASAVAYGVQFGRSCDLLQRGQDPARDAATVLAGNLGDLSTRVADLPTGFAQAAAVEHEASVAAAQAESEIARSAQEEATDVIGSAEHIVRRALDVLRDIDASRSATFDRVLRG